MTAPLWMGILAICACVSCAGSPGARFSKSPSTPVPGILETPPGTKRLRLQYKGESLDLTPEEGRSELSPGVYTVEEWVMERKDDQGRTWAIRGKHRKGAFRFTLAEGGRENLSIGEPLQVVPRIYKRGPDYTIYPRLAGNHKANVALTLDGQPAPLPKLRIYNEDGSYDRTFQFTPG